MTQGYEPAEVRVRVMQLQVRNSEAARSHGQPGIWVVFSSAFKRTVGLRTLTPHTFSLQNYERIQGS